MAVSSVVLAPKVAGWFGERGGAVITVLICALVLLGMAAGNKTVVVIGIVVSGIFSGILNTLFTGTAMSSGTGPRAVNSAGYNFLRWFGGAVSAILVGHVAQWLGMRAPFWVGAICCAVAAGLLLLRSGAGDPDPHSVPEAAAAVGAD